MSKTLGFVKALSIFLGTVVGAGIFGLPYVASKAGFFIVFLYFLILGAIAFFIHLIYGKVALGTAGLHRLPGYVEKYLGIFWKKISFLVIALGLFGAILAYLIIGGQFLKIFISPYFGGKLIVYTLLFFTLGALLIFWGLKSISQVELSLLIVLFIILLLFFFKALPRIDLNNFKNMNLGSLFLPYGVILFSLWGTSVVPEIKEMLEGDRRKIKKVLLSGIIISSIFYLFFAFIVFGVSGASTSKDAISGFANILGNGIVVLGFIFGAIACFTSFITIGLTLKKVLWYDFGLSRNLSWFIACFFPLFLFLLGLREFIDVICWTGALALGIEGIIIVFLYKSFLKKKFSQKMKPVYYLLPLVFFIGIVFEILYLIK